MTQSAQGNRPIGAGDDADVALLAICRLALATTIRAGNVVEPPLSPTQIRTLTLLAAARDGLSVTAVADALAATVPSASRIVQRLVRDGLVERTAGPAHEHRLALSADGAAVLAIVNRARLVPLRALLDRLAVGRSRSVVTALQDVLDAVRDTDEVW